MRYAVYRQNGRFISKKKFDRLKSRGVNGTVKRTYITKAEINDVSELYDYDDRDYEDFDVHEYHGTGDTGKGKR